MATRLVKAYKKDGKDFTTESIGYHIRTFHPEIARRDYGMDGSVRISSEDLEKLGNPQRIKVVIYNID